MAKRAQTVHGFLIYARPQGEHHWICTFLTVELGKIQCRLHGNVPESARQFEIKIKQLDAGFSGSDFRYVDPVLLDSGDAKYFTLYLNELIYRFIPSEHPDDSFYGCYMSSLMQLAAHNPIQPIIRFFEMKTLSLLGMAIDFNRDVNNKPIDSEQYYRFMAGQGFIVDGRGLFSGQRIVAAGQLDMSIAGAMSVARACLKQQLEFVSGGKTIVSRSWPLV